MLDVRRCTTHSYKGTQLYTCRATWRFAGERTGEGYVDAGSEPTRKGSTVAADDWGYRSRGDLLGSVLPKAGFVLLVLGELAVLPAVPRFGRRRRWRRDAGVGGPEGDRLAAAYAVKACCRCWLGLWR
ncbi:hypothetical protein ACFY1L_20800 [Streptomyces sp. NPDC001663]|uniref:hypothetical protein n=1 Tax=Streptomyces sp. NPDC001663 TaxID=3364597 RepID=UPI0036842321